MPVKETIFLIFLLLLIPYPTNKIFAGTIVDGKNTQQEIPGIFEACMPEGYFKLADDGQDGIEKSQYINEKDMDAVLYYDRPEFEISLSTQPDVCIVKPSILSKKFI